MWFSVAMPQPCCRKQTKQKYVFVISEPSPPNKPTLSMSTQKTPDSNSNQPKHLLYDCRTAGDILKQLKWPNKAIHLVKLITAITTTWHDPSFINAQTKNVRRQWENCKWKQRTANSTTQMAKCLPERTVLMLRPKNLNHSITQIHTKTKNKTKRSHKRRVKPLVFCTKVTI